MVNPSQKGVKKRTSLPCKYLLVNHDISKREHPVVLRPLLPEIQRFTTNNHFKVLHPLLGSVTNRFRMLPDTDLSNPKDCRLLALGLHLLENNLVDIHRFEEGGSPTVIPILASFRISVTH